MTAYLACHLLVGSSLVVALLLDFYEGVHTIMTKLAYKVTHRVRLIDWLIFVTRNELLIQHEHLGFQVSGVSFGHR